MMKSVRSSSWANRQTDRHRYFIIRSYTPAPSFSFSFSACYHLIWYGVALVVGFSPVSPRHRLWKNPVPLRKKLITRGRIKIKRQWKNQNKSEQMKPLTMCDKKHTYLYLHFFVIYFFPRQIYGADCNFLSANLRCRCFSYFIPVEQIAWRMKWEERLKERGGQKKDASWNLFHSNRFILLPQMII